MPTDRLPPEVEDWLEEHGDNQSYAEALQLIAQLAPQEPMVDDMGYCVWCVNDTPGHADDCPWLVADRLLQGHPEIERAD